MRSAIHPSRSDWMDVFLCSEAKFFVGNTLGLYLLATAFGTPCALANVIPSSHFMLAPTDISILKLIWSDRLNRYLTFPEIFSRPIANYRFAKLFTENGLRVDENTEEELRELVMEMFDRVEGSYHETAEERALQKQFFSLLRPWHYGHGAAGRIGAGFLKRHRDLLIL